MSTTTINRNTSGGGINSVMSDRSVVAWKLVDSAVLQVNVGCVRQALREVADHEPEVLSTRPGYGGSIASAGEQTWLSDGDIDVVATKTGPGRTAVAVYANPEANAEAAAERGTTLINAIVDNSGDTRARLLRVLNRLNGIRPGAAPEPADYLGSAL